LKSRPNDENHGIVQPMRLLYALELSARGPGDEREGRVARVQVGEVADLGDEHRAAVAARVLERAEHEVVEEQLRAALEEIEQRGHARGPAAPSRLCAVYEQPTQPPSGQPSTVGPNMKW